MTIEFSFDKFGFDKIHSPKSFLTTIIVYLQYLSLILFEYTKDTFLKLFSRFFAEKEKSKPMFSDDELYFKQIFNRIRDCWSRPITSSPSSWIDVSEISRDYTKPPEILNSYKCLNLGSYNYLGKQLFKIRFCRKSRTCEKRCFRFT
jgi:serine palmitoyltransferase